jgi:hypothetical protein
MGRKKKVSLQQAARAALLEEHGLKNNKQAHYWISRCPLKGRDWLFDSDWRLEHYYMCEGDPEVVEVDYSIRRLSLIVEGQARTVRVDARVVLADGSVELRRVQSPSRAEKGEDEPLELACVPSVAAVGARYRRVTVAELDQHKQRIANFRRLYRSWRAECAQRPSELATAVSDVRLRLEQRRALTLEQLALGLPRLDTSLVSAAVASLIRQRLVDSDLDESPLARSTALSWARRRP